MVSGDHESEHYVALRPKYPNCLVVEQPRPDDRIYMVLDTACMRSVEGSGTRLKHQRILENEFGLSFQNHPEFEAFRFGISKCVSKTRNSSPAFIRGNPMFISRSEISENAILPLLGSHPLMDALETIIDVHGGE